MCFDVTKSRGAALAARITIAAMMLCLTLAGSVAVTWAQDESPSDDTDLLPLRAVTSNLRLIVRFPDGWVAADAPFPDSMFITSDETLLTGETESAAFEPDQIVITVIALPASVFADEAGIVDLPTIFDALVTDVYMQADDLEASRESVQPLVLDTFPSYTATGTQTSDGITVGLETLLVYQPDTAGLMLFLMNTAPDQLEAQRPLLYQIAKAARATSDLGAGIEVVTGQPDIPTPVPDGTAIPAKPAGFEEEISTRDGTLRVNYPAGWVADASGPRFITLNLGEGALNAFINNSEYPSGEALLTIEVGDSETLFNVPPNRADPFSLLNRDISNSMGLNLPPAYEPISTFTAGGRQAASVVGSNAIGQRMTLIVDLDEGNFAVLRLYTARDEITLFGVVARTIAGTIQYTGD